MSRVSNVYPANFVLNRVDILCVGISWFIYKKYSFDSVRLREIYGESIKDTAVLKIDFQNSKFASIEANQ